MKYGKRKLIIGEECLAWTRELTDISPLKFGGEKKIKFHIFNEKYKITIPFFFDKKNKIILASECWWLPEKERRESGVSRKKLMSRRP